MSRIKINPLTRTHGYFSVEVDIENGTVKEAYCSGLLFRGFEAMLKGRDPRDAVYLTQRICGICSSAHAMAASKALENAFDIDVPANGRLMRNITFGADILQNHIRHLYVLAIPDYISSPGIGPTAKKAADLRLPPAIDSRIKENYLEALQISDLAHKAVAVFGGKAPHLQSILPGGITEHASAERILRFQSLVDILYKFITEKMIPDLEDIAHYYDDYFKIGRGYGNLLSYGLFVNGNNSGGVSPAGVVIGGEKQEQFSPGEITQEIARSWYRGNEEPLLPPQEESRPQPGKEDAYSWIKAPRYKNLPFEGGPLARMWLAGLYKRGISVMDRLLARALEAKVVAEYINEMLKQVVPSRPVINWVDPLPSAGEGIGLTDSMRGPLAHYTFIRNSRITKYRIVTPSAWNLSPRDGKGRRGPLEEALIGTPVEDSENPVEVGRVVRSYDPCISCAVHVLQRDGTSRPWRRL